LSIGKFLTASTIEGESLIQIALHSFEKSWQIETAKGPSTEGIHMATKIV